LSRILAMLDEPHNLSASIATAKPGSSGPTALARAALASVKAAGWQNRLVQGAAGLLLLRVSLACTTFVLNIVLVRWLGATDYGAYAYSLAWLVVLGVPALLGLDQFLVRAVAANKAHSAWWRVRSLVCQASWAAGLTATVLAVLAGTVAWLWIGPSDERILATFWVALLLLPLITLTRVRQAILQGLHHVVVAQLPETVLQPLLQLALLGGGGLVLGSTLTAPGAMGLNVLATTLAFLAGVVLLWRRLPRVPKGTPPSPADWSWLRTSLPLMCFSAVCVLTAEVDLLILGAIQGPQAVGIYSVAVRTAEIVAFVLQAINPALAPHIANLYALGYAPGLQRLITMAARITLGSALPIGLGLILGGSWLLRLLYGPELVQAQMALIILSIAQLVNVGTGSVGLLLTMTGHERDALLCMGISGVLNLVLCLVLIPAWGVQGAAVAAAAGLILWNLLMAVSAYRRLGIQSSVLGSIRFGLRS
jgi:O-antigen/teichoic acid export membrane protein